MIGKTATVLSAGWRMGLGGRWREPRLAAAVCVLPIAMRARCHCPPPPLASWNNERNLANARYAPYASYPYAFNGTLMASAFLHNLSCDWIMMNTKPSRFLVDIKGIPGKWSGGYCLLASIWITVTLLVMLKRIIEAYLYSCTGNISDIY